MVTNVSIYVCVVVAGSRFGCCQNNTVVVAAISVQLLMFPGS